MASGGGYVEQINSQVVSPPAVYEGCSLIEGPVRSRSTPVVPQGVIPERSRVWVVFVTSQHASYPQTGIYKNVVRHDGSAELLGPGINVVDVPVQVLRGVGDRVVGNFLRIYLVEDFPHSSLGCIVEFMSLVRFRLKDSKCSIEVESEGLAFFSGGFSMWWSTASMS